MDVNLPEDIRTARLILRAIDPGAFDPHRVSNIALADSKEVQAFMACYEQYCTFNQGLWAIVLKESDAFVGFCGLKHFPGTNKTELGFWLMKQYWNSRLTVEAANACLSYGFLQLNLDQIAAKVSNENVAAIKILHRLGMQQRQQLISFERTAFYFAVTKDQWLSLL